MAGKQAPEGGAREGRGSQPPAQHGTQAAGSGSSPPSPPHGTPEPKPAVAAALEFVEGLESLSAKDFKAIKKEDLVPMLMQLRDAASTLKQEVSLQAQASERDALMAKVTDQAHARGANLELLISGGDVPEHTVGSQASPEAQGLVGKVLKEMGMREAGPGPIYFDNAVRVERVSTVKRPRGKPFVLVRFGSEADKNRVLRQKRRLSLPGVRIGANLTYAQRKHRQALLERANRAYEETKDADSKNRIFWLGGWRLILNGEEVFPPNCVELLRDALKPPPPRSGPNRA